MAGLLSPSDFALALTSATPLSCMVTFPLAATKSRKSPSFISWLAFAREYVILSEQFCTVRQGAKVEMKSVTLEGVKASENDHEISLRGPFGGVHNIDVHGNINGEPVKT